MRRRPGYIYINNHISTTSISTYPDERGGQGVKLGRRHDEVIKRIPHLGHHIAGTGARSDGGRGPIVLID